VTTSKPIGSAVLRYENVASTNATAADLLRRKEVENGAVIIAKNQSEGKGQRGNNWSSEHGKNLLCSFVLTPVGLKATNQFLLSAVAALAAQHTVAMMLNEGQASETAKIKWPNDVLINNKKVAGILIENSVQSNEISSSIIGIGINVSQTKFDGLPHASSLFHFMKSELEIEDVLEILIANLNAFYNLISVDPSLLIELFKDHLFARHTWVDLDFNCQQEEFRILGIEEDGRLKIEDRSFRTSSVHHHEVKWMDFQ
jgi:BirA family biotin operon repressor/biotin-[acetyl-CoA-carboxylase] ligase